MASLSTTSRYSASISFHRHCRHGMNPPSGPNSSSKTRLPIHFPAIQPSLPRSYGVLTQMDPKKTVANEMNQFSRPWSKKRVVWKDAVDVPEDDHSPDVREYPSPHRFMSLNHVVAFLHELGLQFPTDFRHSRWIKGDQDLIQVRLCPNCHPIKDDPSNMWVMGIFKTGGFHCFRCKTSGNWDALKKSFLEKNKIGMDESRLSDLRMVGDFTPFPQSFMTGDTVMDLDPHTLSHGFGTSKPFLVISKDRDILPFSDLEEKVAILNSNKAVYKRIENIRKISLETMQEYRVGYSFHTFKNRHFKAGALFFPMFLSKQSYFDQFGRDHDEMVHENSDMDLKEMNEYVVVKYKVRGYQMKAFTQHPSNCPMGWFGLSKNNSPQMTDTIVVTEGEFDAMAIYEGTKGHIKAISVPNGAATTDLELIQELTPYKRIILWFDWDDAGYSGALKVKEILQDSLHYTGDVQILAKPKELKKYDEIKDPNEILMQNMNGDIDFSVMDVLRPWIDKNP